MRAPLSIIIPTLNAGHDLPETLACLMEGVERGLVRELIISDGGSSDATEKLVDQAGATFLKGEPGRGAQLGRGAAAARGEWMLFLHADTHLAKDWAQCVEGFIPNDDVAGYFWLKFRANGLRPWFVAAWANLRSRMGLPYGDQGLLISRALYDQIGGYADIPLMEDVKIAAALRGRMHPVGSVAITSAQRYLDKGWFRQGIRNFWNLARYFVGVDPEMLAKSYRR